MIRSPFLVALGLSLATMLMALAPPVLAQSAPPLHLREGEVPVPDQSTEARQVGLREALAQVLVRMSGSSAVADDPLIRRSLDQAGALLQHYSYRQEVVTRPGEPPRLQLYLLARFDGEGVDRLLDAAGVRLWLARRPSTLLLIEVDDGENRKLIGEEDGDELLAFHQRARLRGLPLVLPLLDLEEQIRLTPQALGAGLRDVLGDMGQRYGAASVLHGRLTRLADFWVSSWTLQVDGTNERWESVGAFDSVLLSGADGLGDALGKRYALSSAERLGGSYRIWVSGLQAPADYPRLMRYLNANPLIRESTSERADGDRLLLRLNASASLERLLQSLTLGYTLAPDPAAAPDAEDARLLLLP